MSEAGQPLESTAGGRSAGALLRQARKAQGLHIGALATAIKVTPQKLEALENDRYEELPDATFARALAKAVCRVLKIDAEPILALLPKNSSQGFERLGGGLNTPYRERSGRGEAMDLSMLRSPVIWGPVLLLIAAAVVLLMPLDLSRFRRAETAADASASAPISAETGVFASSPIVSVPASAPEVVVPPFTPAASAGAAAAPTPAAEAAAPTASPGGDTTPAGLVVLITSKESWVEVVDSQGHTLLSRSLQADEHVALDGTPPLRVKIGNAKATQLVFRGQPVDLAPATRDNIARLELK